MSVYVVVGDLLSSFNEQVCSGVNASDYILGGVWCEFRPGVPCLDEDSPSLIQFLRVSAGIVILIQPRPLPFAFTLMFCLLSL